MTAKKVSATDLRTFRTFLLMQQFAAHEIGGRIAQARLEAGRMTQEQLADLLGVTTRTVQTWEAGGSIPWKHLQRIEQIFGRSVSWFLRGEDESEDDRLSRLEQQMDLVIQMTEQVLARVEPSHPRAAPE